MTTMIALVKKYAKSGTYFVRKISAQSLLSILPYEKWISEIQETFNFIKQGVDSENKKLKQNEAHGLMVRVNIIMAAYFKYREIAVGKGGEKTPQPEVEEFLVKRQIDFDNQEKIIFDELMKFQENLPKLAGRYSGVTRALFLKTFRQTLRTGSASYHVTVKNSLLEGYNAELKIILTSLKDQVQDTNNQLALPLDVQSYLTQMTKFIFWLQSITVSQDPNNNVLQTLKDVLAVTSSRYLDLTYVVMKAFRKHVHALSRY